MGLLDRLVAIWRREHPEERLEFPTSGISRRRFVGLLAGSAAVAAAAPMLDIERLVWTPGQMLGGQALEAAPLIVVPEVGGNILLTPEWVTRECMKYLRDNLKMVSAFNRTYDTRFNSATLLNPNVEFTAPKWGVTTVDDWRRDIVPEIQRNAQMLDAPLPIDAHTTNVVLATEKDVKAYGVTNRYSQKMTVKVVS